MEAGLEPGARSVGATSRLHTAGSEAGAAAGALSARSLHHGQLQLPLSQLKKECPVASLRQHAPTVPGAVLFPEAEGDVKENKLTLTLSNAQLAGRRLKEMPPNCTDSCTSYRRIASRTSSAWSLLTSWTDILATTSFAEFRLNS